MRMISGKKAAELSAMYPSSAFFSDPSIHMEYASWKKGEILVSAFDMPKYLIFLFSGTVKISAYRDDGSEFVLPTEENIVIGDIQLMTEEEVCKRYNADSKAEMIDMLNEEIAFWENEAEAFEEDEEEYDEWDAHGFANEADYIRWRYL